MVGTITITTTAARPRPAILGLGAAAIIGGVIASQQPQYYAPPPPVVYAPPPYYSGYPQVLTGRRTAPERVIPAKKRE